MFKTFGRMPETKKKGTNVIDLLMLPHSMTLIYFLSLLMVKWKFHSTFKLNFPHKELFLFSFSCLISDHNSLTFQLFPSSAIHLRSPEMDSILDQESKTNSTLLSYHWQSFLHFWLHTKIFSMSFLNTFENNSHHLLSLYKTWE